MSRQGGRQGRAQESKERKRGRGRQTGRESWGYQLAMKEGIWVKEIKNGRHTGKEGKDNYRSEGDGTGRKGGRQGFQQVKKQEMQVRRESLTNYRQEEEGGSGG